MPVTYRFQTNLEGTATAALHQIADMSCLNACANEWLYIVVVEVLQLQISRHQQNARKCTRCVRKKIKLCTNYYISV